MSFIVIIPARFASSRFPGKPLVQLTGATGVRKSLIQRSWECAMAIPESEGVWVATDDERIADEVRGFGGHVVMTSPDCANGTERCAEAMDLINSDAKFVVNLQGDAPLTPSYLIPELVKRLREDHESAMATPVVRCSPSALRHLISDEKAGRVGGTTAVFNRLGQALYFSKRIIPYVPGCHAESPVPVHLHLGIYAYRKRALSKYAVAPRSELELLEGLEQLRFLDLGLQVSVLPVEPLGWDPIELNNPSDVASVEATLAACGLA